MVSEARVQIARRTFDFPSVLKEPALELSNFIIMGKSTSDVDFYGETRLQYAQSLAWTTGGHQVKGGFDLNHLRDTIPVESVLPGTHHFPLARRVRDIHACRLLVAVS